jgi:hypothetical protein
VIAFFACVDPNKASWVFPLNRLFLLLLFFLKKKKEKSPDSLFSIWVAPGSESLAYSQRGVDGINLEGSSATLYTTLVHERPPWIFRYGSGEPMLSIRGGGIDRLRVDRTIKDHSRKKKMLSTSSPLIADVVSNYAIHISMVNLYEYTKPYHGTLRYLSSNNKKMTNCIMLVSIVSSGKGYELAPKPLIYR